DSVKQNCDSDHESQAGDVLRRRVGDDLAELLPADDIAQQNVADEERERKKNAVLGNLLENFPSGPRRTVQLALRWRVAFYEVFDFAKDHFHHHGLRAGPAAPEPAKRRREYQDAHDKDQHGDGKDDHVLRPEYLAEHDELAFADVHQQERIAADGDERPGEHDEQEQPTEPGAPAKPSSVHFARINPLTAAFAVGRGDVVAEVGPVNLLDGIAIFGLRFINWLGHVSEAPNFKHQAPEKFQTPNIQRHATSRLGCLKLEVWSFSGAWMLVLGFFISSYSNRLGPVLTGV